MSQYDKAFKQESIKLSDEMGVKRAAEQLGIPYFTLSEWRRKRKQYGEAAHIGSGHARIDLAKHREQELEREVMELRRANAILKEALGFFAKDQKR
jgi:transposase